MVECLWIRKRKMQCKHIKRRSINSSSNSSSKSHKSHRYSHKRLHSLLCIQRPISLTPWTEPARRWTTVVPVFWVPELTVRLLSPPTLLLVNKLALVLKLEEPVFLVPRNPHPSCL